MNIPRLQHLITVLQAVSPQQLEMGDWFDDCNSAACAVGWACQDPVFNEQGLRRSLRVRITTLLEQK